MAESQTPYAYVATGPELIESLSVDRFSTYLADAKEDQEYAFKLYLYNARLAKAFLYPLHILEITLRNRINHILSNSFGEMWPHNQALRYKLSTESLRSLDTGIDRAKSNSTVDIVSVLTFDFWSNLFRSEYDRPLWQTNMNSLLPNKRYTRKQFQKEVRHINLFRNRIAHHEPIFKYDISKEHARILATLDASCSSTGDWVKHHSTVNQIMRTKPSAQGHSGPFIKDRCDSNMTQVNTTDTLSTLITVNDNSFILCQKNHKTYSIFRKADIGRYLMQLIDADNELITDMDDHTYDLVINNLRLSDNFVIMSGSDSLSLAANAMSRGKEYILAMDKTNVIGVIAKSHRRY
jgi:hypothetical protein